MDSKSIKAFVNDNPEGVEIEMIDGTMYRIKHRDYVWFTPAYGKPESQVGRLATSFYIHDIERDETRLINALLVKQITKLKPNGHRSQGKRKKTA